MIIPTSKSHCLVIGNCIVKRGSAKAMQGARKSRTGNDMFVGLGGGAIGTAWDDAKPITLNSVHIAYYVAMGADDEFTAELVRTYGREACNARYDGRGRATPELRRLAMVKDDALNNWRALGGIAA